MHARHIVTVGAMIAAVSCGLAACGSDGGTSTSGSSDSTGSTTLTVYSSLPLRGPARTESISIANAEKLALQQAGGRVGEFTVKYVALDDSTSEADRWDPGATAGNARRAAQDKTLIAYLGELDSGASAISIPILNEINALQVSPASTAVGLTRSDHAEKGEPDKYYPAGTRTFGRVVPTDDLQAAAQVAYQRRSGCTRLYLLDDRNVYGRGLVGQLTPLLRDQGLAVVGTDSIDENAANYQPLAKTVAASDADCIFFGGSAGDHVQQLWRDLHAAAPRAKLFGGDALAHSSFPARLPADAARLTYLTSPALPARLYPPAARTFFRQYRRAYGTEPEPMAIFGYEAMGVVLDAIRRAGPDGNNRQAVINAFFKTKDRKSVLGTYSIRDSGDTTLGGYAGYRIRDGRLSFDRMLRSGE